jgi:vacuolar-type H+-ATPase subunit B/Vma2
MDAGAAVTATDAIKEFKDASSKLLSLSRTKANTRDNIWNRSDDQYVMNLLYEMQQTLDRAIEAAREEGKMEQPLFGSRD